MSEKEDSTLSPRGEASDEQARAAAEWLVKWINGGNIVAQKALTVARYVLSLRAAPPASTDEQAKAAAERTIAAFAWAAGYKPHSKRPERDAFHAARAYIELLDRPSPPPVLSNWREIETAPKDGTRVLAELEDGEGIEIIEWEADGWKGPGWVHATGKWSTFPVRWWPLPAPPGAGGDEDKDALSDRDDRSDEHSTLIVALTKAAEQFAFYAKNHRAKAVASMHLSVSRDATEKAEVNERMASMCRAAITAYQKATGGEPRDDSEHPSAEDGGAG